MPTDEAREPTPIASESVRWEGFGDVPNYRARWRHLTRAAWGPDYRIGVVIAEIPPGGRSAPFHYHLAEEEHVYVLDGAATLRLGETTHRMGPGDYACFPARQRAGHCLLNEGDTAVRYVVIGEQNPNDVVVYPDSNKVKIRALGEAGILDLAACRCYWDGEEPGFGEGEHVAGSAPALRRERAPKPPIAAASVEWNDEGPGKGTRFGGRSRHLTGAVVGDHYAVGVLIESPAPGRRLCPRHWHTAEEEHALILEGEVTLLLGEDRHVMRPGDYAVLPAGQVIGHSFLNSGDGSCAYLMIGHRDPDDVCVYPDSAKLGVAALTDGPRLFDMGAVRRYWDREALD